MKKSSLILVSMLAIIIVLSGCNSKTTNNTTNTPTSNAINEVQNNEGKSQNSVNETMNVKPVNEQSKTTQNQQNMKGQPISESDLQIGNLKLNMSIDEFKKVINSNIKSKGKFGKVENVVFEDGTEIATLNGVVKKIIIKSTSYTTPRGLKVGDNIKKANDLYGKPLSSDGDPETNTFEYVYELSSKNATFNVEYRQNGKIESICLIIDADKW